MGYMAHDNESDSVPFFLLWCLVCHPVPTADNPMPFGSAAERGRWAAAHTRGTGHDTWRVIDLPASEPAGSALVKLASEDYQPHTLSNDPQEQP